MINWYAVIVPVILSILGAALLTLIPAVLRSSNRIAILEERTERNRADNAEERRRNDIQDVRQGASDLMLTRIDSNLTTLMRRLEQQGHLP